MRMSNKIVINKFKTAFTFMFCLVVLGAGLNAQEIESDSVPSTYKEPSIIYELAYKPFIYGITTWDPDIQEFVKISMFVDDENLMKKNLLKSFALSGSVALRLKPRHYIKTGLSYSHTLFYYNTYGIAYNLPKYDEYFSTEVYNYVNTLKFEHVQIPLLWSYQSYSDLTRLTFSFDAGLLFSGTVEYMSESSLYRREREQGSGESIKTDKLVYRIIMDSKNNEHKNIRYNSEGDVKDIKYNSGQRVARRFIVGGFSEVNMHYNITSSIRVGVGAWLNVDFSSMEKQGRAGELLPLVSASFNLGDNIIHYYGIRYGLALSVGYMW